MRDSKGWMLTTAGLLGRALHEEHAGGSVDELLEAGMEQLLGGGSGAGSGGRAGRVPLNLLCQLRGVGTVQPVHLLTVLWG